MSPQSVWVKKNSVFVETKKFKSIFFSSANFGDRTTEPNMKVCSTEVFGFTHHLVLEGMIYGCVHTSIESWTAVSKQMSRIAESKINTFLHPHQVLATTFQKSLSWLVSFARTTYFSYSVIHLQTANRNTHCIRLSNHVSYLSQFFHQEISIKKNQHKILFSFFELI